MVEIGSDFSGVGAFDEACKRVFGTFDNIFACDMDKFARKSYLANNEAPGYYPENVYGRTIPEKPLDIYMTSPPCQSFSIAGKRQGKNSDNGVLFFNSHEFIQKNNPRYFIFENVKGLLSDDNGKTFNEWITMLGGKSVNGNPVIFPFENSVPYHIYWKVLNSKKHGVPQNRERVFIVGIRDDSDNVFTWPKEEHLTKKLKDVLETEVDEKYFLSEKTVNQLINNTENTDYLDVDKNDFSKTLRCGGGGSLTKKHSYDIIKVVGNTSPSGNGMNGGNWQPFCCIPVLTPDRKEKRQNGRGFKNDEDKMFTITTQDKHGVFDGFKIRRLTPRECFRLQDFPDTFKFVCSDSQLYKQAGNSIAIRVLELIIRKLNFENQKT